MAETTPPPNPEDPRHTTGPEAQGADAPTEPGPAEPPSSDARTLAALAHVLGIVLCILGPFIIWMIKKDEHPFVDDQAKEAMNFQLLLLIFYVAGVALSCLFFPTVVAAVAWVVGLILAIMAGMAANEGKRYRYPFAIRVFT